MGKFCTKCGAELRAGANFCVRCGEPVIAGSDEIRIKEDGKGGLIFEVPEGSTVVISDEDPGTKM